jgi:membrane protein
MAFYTAIAIIPLVFLVIEVTTLLMGHQRAEAHLLGELEKQMGARGAQALVGLIDNWRASASTGMATVVALVTLLTAAGGAFDQLQDALNAIWGVAPKEQSPIWAKFRRRFLSVLSVLGTAFLLLVSLLITEAVSVMGSTLIGPLAQSDPTFRIMSELLSLIVVIVLFALIFKTLPSAKVAWRDVWMGASITGVLFAVGKMVIILYLGRSTIVSLYGSAGSMVIILLWSYYASQILLFGAEFTAMYASACGSRVLPADDAVAIAEPARTDQRESLTQRRRD